MWKCLLKRSKTETKLSYFFILWELLQGTYADTNSCWNWLTGDPAVISWRHHHLKTVSLRYALYANSVTVHCITVYSITAYSIIVCTVLTDSVINLTGFQCSFFELFEIKTAADMFFCLPQVLICSRHSLRTWICVTIVSNVRGLSWSVLTLSLIFNSKKV